MQNKVKAALFLLLGVMGFKSLPAEAAVDMFLCSNDAKLKGESLDANNKECIDILAWSWGASNSGTLHVGGGGGAGRANFQDLSITKYIDSSSDNLLRGVSTGDFFTDAELKVYRAGGCATGCSDPYISIKLDTIIATSQSMGGSGGEDRLTENITLNFAKFEYCYTKLNENGSQGAQQCFGWDIPNNIEQ